MIEYSDNKFGDKIPLGDAMKEINHLFRNNIPFRALHVGTPIELEKVKEKASLDERLNEVEKKIKEFVPITSSILHIPSNQEVELYK